MKPSQHLPNRGDTDEQRRHDKLSPEDLDDLDSYATYLRNYYDIPPDQPVFPPRGPRSKRRQQPGDKPTAKGKNRADHPWRGTL